MQKIYVRKWIFLCALMLVNLLIASRTQIAVFYFLSWSILTLIVVSGAYLIAVHATVQLRLTRKTIGRIEEDDVLTIRAVIENKGALPLTNVVIEDFLPFASNEDRQKRTYVEYLRRNSPLAIEYQCRCPLRGIYQLGPFTAYFFDPFGLFFISKKYFIRSELHVYPRTFVIRKFPPLKKGILPWFGIETVRASGDDDEFFGVREYKEGDAIQRIHWLTSARKNRLIVKQFQRQGFYRATLLFTLEKERNYGEGKECVAEYIIKIAASVARYLLGQNIAVELIAHDGEFVHIPSNKGQQHLESLFGFFAKARAESAIGLGEILQESFRYIPDDSSVIVIMLDRDWEHMIKILRLEKRNVFFVPLVLISSTFQYGLKEPKILDEIKIKLSREFNFVPLMFSRGENLEEAFLRQ
jgi:uncharacterized protein (DUF58 family)